MLSHSPEGSTDGRPAVLGYWMGYRIAKGYYARAADRTAAIGDMLRIEDSMRSCRPAAWRGVQGRGGLIALAPRLAPAWFSAFSRDTHRYLDTGHNLHREDPAAVVDAIREVVALAAAREPRRCGADAGRSRRITIR